MAEREKDPMSDKEPAEGSRETVDEALKAQEQDTKRQPGITNKPLEEEEAQQRELPPRGHAKSEGA